MRYYIIIKIFIIVCLLNLYSVKRESTTSLRIPARYSIPETGSTMEGVEWGCAEEQIFVVSPC